jgi:hypothetical protein
MLSSYFIPFARRRQIICKSGGKQKQRPPMPLGGTMPLHHVNVSQKIVIKKYLNIVTP